MRIVIGGVPYGCDNIGDEAILASVIRIFQKNFPGSELVVSTGTPEATAAKFGIRTIPLYGFDPQHPAENIAQELDDCDLFVWSGATGLSDYPEMGCKLLATARAKGLETIVWNVGMNDKLNPAFYTLGGKKAKLAALVRKFTTFDLKSYWENCLVSRAEALIADELAQCKLIVLRDERSLRRLRECAPFPDAITGADSAILQSEVPFEALPWQTGQLEQFQSRSKRIAICVSAQNAIRQTAELCDWIDGLTEKHDVLPVMIPMNPKTDYELMKKIQTHLRHPERTLLTDFSEPEEVQAEVGHCCLVVSSRLHLLILGLNRLVPGIGIARGSKINSYLDLFELPTAGSVDDIDFSALKRETDRYLYDNSFAVRAEPIRETMLKQLAAAELKLRSIVRPKA